MRRLPEYRLKLVRDLRKRQTESEQILWEHLRGSQLDGLKFRRQRPLDRYIADFCCDAIKLIIEIDGGGHEGVDPQEYDEIRDRLMSAHGFAILRVTALDVVANTATVLQRIRDHAAARQLPHPNPSPARGEGPF